MIQTLETGGNYTLGFRVDPAARLVDVFKELDSLFAIYSVTPIFGVAYDKKEVSNRIFIQIELVTLNSFQFIYYADAGSK